MAERRVLAVRVTFDALTRELYRFGQVALLIEVRLREEKVPLGKVRVDVDRPLELGDLSLPITHSFMQASEVERGLIAVRMELDLRPVFGNRACEITLF